MPAVSNAQKLGQIAWGSKQTATSYRKLRATCDPRYTQVRQQVQVLDALR